MKQNYSIKAEVKNYTVEDIEREVNEDVRLVAALGYPELLDNEYDVVINHKRAKALGRCTKIGRTNKYTITINKNHLEFSAAKEVHNTIMHEVIHSVHGCMNHGPKWQKIAHEVNNTYEFTPITRVANISTPEYEEYSKNQYKYVIECSKCHSKWRYMRKTRTVQACQRGSASCSCGGKNFIVTENFQEVKNDYSL